MGTKASGPWRSRTGLVWRQCGADLHYVLSRHEPKGVFARIHMSGDSVATSLRVP